MKKIEWNHIVLTSSSKKEGVDKLQMKKIDDGLRRKGGSTATSGVMISQSRRAQAAGNFLNPSTLVFSYIYII